MLKTYGVFGLMDWHCEIPVGQARAIIEFSGGATTQYGITPAEFATTDPVLQHIIEHSDYFRAGRIRLVRTSGAPATAPVPDASVPRFPSNPVDTHHGKSETATADTPLAVVPVAGLSEAQAYLRDNHNIPTSRSRSRDKAQTIARECGFTFSGLD